jgi:hypothetical protein
MDFPLTRPIDQGPVVGTYRTTGTTYLGNNPR